MVAAQQDTHDLVVEALGDLPSGLRALVREIRFRSNEGSNEYWGHAESPPGVPELSEEQELSLYALEDALYARQPEPYPTVFVQHAGRYLTDHYVFRPQPRAYRIYPAVGNA